MCNVRLLALAALGAALMSQSAVAAGSAQKGKDAYVKHGCWQCHGFMGQGGITGPKLAPDPMPFDALKAFIRFTNGSMPPYPVTILSDADLADIYAFLQSIPKARDYKSIPLLAQ